ncbi:hypothetical protein KDK77_06235 [bacterium]|nr:hypothetical protein [bacterium]MCP5463058.1 hypothetical protein [bacterium]
MNYKDNSGALITSAQNEFEKAEYYNKDIVMVFNASTETPPQETFYEEGAVAMEEAINDFTEEYDNYSGYSEDAIFEYKNGYKDI